MVTTAASAQTTIASWDFTKKYTNSSTEGTNAYYTPSSDAFVAIDKANFATAVPFFYPLTFAGTQTNHTISGNGSQWQVSDVNGGADCFQVANNPSNSLADITDASSHKSYIEISFDATGYKDIKVNAQLNYTDNGAVPMGWAVSTDGGATWADGGTTNSTGDWWRLASSGDKSLAVANQSNVKIRIVGEAANTTKWWGVNAFTVTGTAITSETIYHATAAADNSEHGTAVVSPVGGYVESGSTVTVTATKKTGWKFKEWQKDGVAVSTDNPYSYTISGNTALVAVFEAIPTYTLATSVSPLRTGTVSRSINADAYDENASVTLTATPSLGYTFVEWQDGSDNQVSTDNPYTFNINANTTLKAVFKRATLAAGTETTIVQWTFNEPYSVDGNVYTPTDGDFSEINLTASSQLLPNAAVNALNSTSYMKENWTASGGQYKIRYNYSNDDQRCLGLINTSNSNNITDYTDASQHDGYFEANFSTVDFEDVAIKFTGYRNANGGAGDAPAMHVAYSFDEGSTWADGGETALNTNWWVAKEVTPTVSIDNKTKVIVRVFPNNEHVGYWYLDDFTVTGRVMARSLTIGDTGYATYYNDCAVEIPAGLTAYWGKLSSDGTKVEMTEITDGIIPAETAVVVKGTANTYTLTATADAGSTYAANALRGVVANTTVASLGLGSGTLYVLAKAASTNKAAFCPYTGASLGDHRAYLFVPSAAPAPMLSLDFGEGTTGIADVKAGVVNAENIYYNLNGQRVDNGYKGIVIGNGKKVIKK